MVTYQNTFQRHEIKFLIDEEQREMLEMAFPGRMQEDYYGKSVVRSLYFDTPSHLLIRRSIEKPVYKEKLRLRSYGQATPDDDIFVELKKKYRGVGFKRRIKLPEAEAMLDLCSGQPLADASQIAREIDYFCSMYQQLQPSLLVSYNRTAYRSCAPDDLRITFDDKILWRLRDLSLTAPIYGMPLLAKGQVLMEIKTGLAIPLWLSHLLNDNGIFKTSFSKYGKAYLAYCENAHNLLTRGVICA